MDLDSLEKQAHILLQESCSPHGILASPSEQDNYRRLWSRDSMIAGIAGLLTGNETVIEGFRKSILTLSEHQHERGMIPSNVSPDRPQPEISYGTLAGRVDATTWFIIGAGLYLLHEHNKRLKKTLHPNIKQALKILDAWEFNGRGLLYTPLSGNWADEYPIEGHTLYDNILRMWALKLYAELYEDRNHRKQAYIIKERIEINFWPQKTVLDHPGVYHRQAFQEAADQDLTHFACAIDPRGYNMHFDTAGHSLALLLGLASGDQTEHINNHIANIFEDIGASLLPAFWPIITEKDESWPALRQNYSYDFKNKPYHFHNGGIWPVWMGWFALGMTKAGHSSTAENMLQALIEIENPEDLEFCEYIASDTLRPGGKKRLCYSASGLLFLIHAVRNGSLDKLQLN